MNLPVIYFSKTSIFTLFKSIYYALFILLVPWQYIMKQEGGWQDFQATAEYYGRVLQSKVELYNINSITGYLSFEVVWDYLMIFLTSVFGNPEIGLRIISFLILFIWGIFLFKRMPLIWALLFLINPLSIDISMSIIRNGFAWSLILYARYVASNKLIKYSFYLISPFIHVSSLGMIFLMIVDETIKRTTNSKKLAIILMGFAGISLGIMLTIGSQILSSFLSDGRLSSDYVRGGGSVLQALFFIILLGVQISSSKDYVYNNLFTIGLLFWYLTMNPFIPWSYRLWSASIPLIAYSIWKMPLKSRQFILFLWFGNLILWYLYWSKLFDIWYPL